MASTRDLRRAPEKWLARIARDEARRLAARRHCHELRDDAWLEAATTPDRGAARIEAAVALRADVASALRRLPRTRL
jgi:hypothetical protein